MSGDPGPDLDGDPEALEDPVHRGDATHQHDVHQHQHDVHQHQQGADDARADEPPADGD